MAPVSSPKYLTFDSTSTCLEDRLATIMLYLGWIQTYTLLHCVLVTLRWSLSNKVVSVSRSKGFLVLVRRDCAFPELGLVMTSEWKERFLVALLLGM